MTVESATAAPAAGSVQALDVFRALAAVFMVVNHAGFAWLSNSDASTGPSGLLVALGSFAPVLFFFGTGFALGLPGQADRGLTLDRLWKCALLIAADQFLFWSRGELGGLDFFGFIALSMVVLYAIGRLTQATSVAMLLLVGVLALRFGVGPIIKSEIPETGLLAFMTGVYGQVGISYPLAPWLAYPLLGYLAARLHVATVANPRQFAIRLTAALAIGAVALVMHGRGMSFHRWASMALAYFVLSLSVLIFAWLVSTLLDRYMPRFAKRFGLRGVAAFLVVPIHYALVKVAALLYGLPMTFEEYGIASIALVIATFFLSNLGARFAADTMAGGRLVTTGLLILATICAAISVTLSSAWPLIAFSAATIGQVVMAALLARRQVSRSGPSSAS